MSDEKISRNRVWRRILTLALLVVAVMLLAFSGGWWALAQEGNWTAPTVISPPPAGKSWFPDLAVDGFGSVHVIWCGGFPREWGRVGEQVGYTHWNGESWSQPNDIVAPSADIIRNAIAVDRRNVLHMLFGGSVYSLNYTLDYQRAPVEDAWSVAGWSTSHRLNQGAGGSYMSDIAIDSQGTIHVVYDDTLRYPGDEETAVADIFYRHSVDGGQTWSLPVNLFPSRFTGSAREQIEIDSNDTIHVTWDEGWDRLTGFGDRTSIYSAYTFSSDGGRTWYPVTSVSYPDATVAQLTVGSDGEGGVMLVWRTGSRDELFYLWSTDGGHSWGAPSVIPRVFARPWDTPFDMYDMAADSAGHIHLLVVGRQSQEKDALLGVYHLVWDGIGWSTPTRIFATVGLNPAYPKIVVHEGNQLHAVWHTREGSVFDEEANREVWYSRGQSSAPHQPLTPVPTSTPRPPTATPSPTPTVTPYPTLSLENTGLPDGLYTESDEVFRLAIALSPVALLVLVVMVVGRGWFGKLRR